MPSKNLAQRYESAGTLSSTVQIIGLVVFTVTILSPGTRWFDVETIPSKHDSVSAIVAIVNGRLKAYRGVLYILKFHSKPGVEVIRLDLSDKSSEYHLLFFLDTP